MKGPKSCKFHSVLRVFDNECIKSMLFWGAFHHIQQYKSREKIIKTKKKNEIRVFMGPLMGSEGLIFNTFNLIRCQISH